MEARQIMMNDKEFLTLFNDDPLDNSQRKRLRKIIDDELEKPVEEMDTELIDYCLDMLNTLEKKVQEKDGKKKCGDSDGKHIKQKFKKVIILVAIIAVLLVGTVSVSAVFFDYNLIGGVVELYKDYIRINFDEIDDKSEKYELLGTELAKELADNDLQPVLLPEIILSEKFEISKIDYEKTEHLITANIVFKCDKGIGYVDISKYSAEELVPDIEFLDVSSAIEQIKIDNLIVFIFQQNENYTITYRDGLFLYTILVPFNYDETIEFAQTIK